MYYNDIYMENLKLIYEKYHKKKLLLLGDLNARVADIIYKNQLIKHNKNPDTVINTNGRNVHKWIEQRQDMVMLNGLIKENVAFDTNYTFFRGKLMSQNDLVFSNDPQSISFVTILPKMTQSDHCPVTIGYEIKLDTPLDFVHDCAYHTFNNDQYDINRRVKQSFRLDKIDIPKALEKLSVPFDIGTENNNTSATKLSNHIYDCFTTSKKEREEKIHISDNLLNCTSSHFKAIAEAHLLRYQSLSAENHPNAPTYLESWIKFDTLAREATNRELNVKVNKSWKSRKFDGKKLWQAVDWKGSAEQKTEKPAHEADTMKYFTSIFQSTKTKDHDTIMDIRDELDNYDNYVPSLDNPFTMEELEKALKLMGTGVSLDGIPPAVATILPQNIKENILELINRVFDGMYPGDWTRNILHSIKKDGHTSGDPKLRGIAIGLFLCRIYDIMVDERFCSWFKTNREQAAGTKGQGCPLQIFMLLLVIDYARQKGKDLFIGFLDYEKAFDFANRAGLVSDLMKNECGSKFTKAIAKMLTTTTYYPKSNKSFLSEGIPTDYGVTQGRRSSGSLFSFYVSDMPDALNDIEYDDYMDPLSLAQLADDSAIYAEKVKNLICKFRKIFEYSRKKNQVANIKKTVYGNFSSDPMLTPLEIEEAITLESIDPDKGYKYIGLFVFPTNDITQIIIFNINKRMGNFAKFHAWLDINELTPIEVKFLVYDSCVLGAVLYSCECWGDVSCVEEKLKEAELKAIRAILGVKTGTTIDLIYHELRRCSIVSKIRDRQFKFFSKISEMSANDAIAKMIVDMFEDSTMLNYYKNLDDKNGDREMREREERIHTSQQSMCRYYVGLNLTPKCDIYNAMLSDYYRVIISRWRLSNHRLNIETGRYTKPITNRKDRVCSLCGTIEDEEHVIFSCPRYNDIRKKYKLVVANKNTQTFLNPSYNEMKDTANFIYDVEKRRKELSL